MNKIEREQIVNILKNIINELEVFGTEGFKSSEECIEYCSTKFTYDCDVIVEKGRPFNSNELPF